MTAPLQAQAAAKAGTTTLTTGWPFMTVLSGLIALTAITIDIAIPALGLMASDLGAPPADGAQTITVYFAGYAIGQLVWGPVSDAYGRKPVLYAGLSFFVLSSIACAMATDMNTMLAARLAQGFAGGSTPTLARAIVRDIASGATAARLMSTLTMILGLAPLLAPAAGSAIIYVADWRATFWLLVLLGVLLIIGTLRIIPETTDPTTRNGLRLARIAGDTRFALTQPIFWLGTLTSGFVFVGYAAVLSIGAVAMEAAYAVPPTGFGPLFGVGAATFVLGATMSRSLAVRLSPLSLLGIGVGFSVLAGFGLLASLVLPLSLWTYWAIVALYILGFGLTLPNATVLALEPFGGRAGYGSALHGALISTIGGLGGLIPPVLAETAYGAGAGPLSLTMAGASAAALLTWLLTRLIR